MRSEGYSSWFVCLSVCLATLIQALQATRHPISDTRGYASLKTAFEHGSDATYYTLPSVDGVVAIYKRSLKWSTYLVLSGLDPSN